MSQSAPPHETEAFPKAYAPFEPVLEALSRSLREALRGPLAQLEPLLRLVGEPRDAERGEFEGFDGLTHRGDLSQIVQSELLLRTEAPMEFLRRLAEAETLFHRRQFADPGMRQVYRAMISVGPGSLGHGRILALAAVFFLARAAQARGADFHWCFLPRQEGAVWFDGLSINAVKRMLKAASYREMSLQDMATAASFWAMKREAGADVDPGDLIDWAIGAMRPRDRRDDDRGSPPRAAEMAGNSLGFQLASPVPGEPRAAIAVVGRSDGRQARATLRFPEDSVCASALKTPFRPFAPPRGRPPPPTPQPSTRHAGWEAQHLLLGPRNEKVIRYPDGLLILTFTDAGLAARWFVPIPPEERLVGFHLEWARITIVTQRGLGRDGSIAYGRRALAERGESTLEHWKVEVSAEQLFRKQPPMALPTLQSNPTPGFYSSAGMAYALSRGESSASPGFSPQVKAPQILASTGVHHVVAATQHGRPVFEVRRQDGGFAEVYEGPQEGMTSVRGVVYPRAEKTLAYSPAPNTWVLPPRRPTPMSPQGDASAGFATLRLQPSDTLLTARLIDGQIGARVWSDARRGGDGVVRSLRQTEDGQQVIKGVVQALGREALSIVKVAIGDDGAWALAVEDDEPARLIRYRGDGKGSRATTYDLREVKARAAVISFGDLHG